MADMKAGLAILLQALFEHRNPAVNLLFMGVPDEENMSSGALQSIPLLHQLRQRFGLDYSLLILGEPQCHNVENCRDVQLVGGSTGKMLPVVLTKGILTHAADILKGINSAFMLAEIVRRVELNPDLAAEHLGCFAQPPTVQIMRDQKTTYDVSVPEFSAACFNFMFLRNRTPMSLVEALGDLCRQAMEAVVARYQAAFDHMAAGGGIAERARLRFTPEVLTLSQLEGRLREQGGDFAAFRKEITGQLGERIRSGQCNLPGASVLYMKALVERSRITGPVVLIGISPPYYPSVNTAAIGKDIAPILAGLDGYMRAKYGSGVVDVPYCAGMTDMSYTSCLDPGTERRFLDNLALPTDLYDVPVEGIGELNIPALIIGPQGKDIHKRGERVYLPDVTGRIPDLIGRIIEQA
jgi:arginine utilization protein RocB